VRGYNVGMDAQRKPTDGRKILVLLVVACLPLVYGLSTGPAAWLHTRRYISQKTYLVYVTPMAATRKVCPPLHLAMNWYLAFWV